MGDMVQLGRRPCLLYTSLGEFGLIKHLTKDIELKNPETQYDVGDDAAVLEFKDKEVLVTTDLLMEGVHFDLVYTPCIGLQANSPLLISLYRLKSVPITFATEGINSLSILMPRTVLVTSSEFR